VDAVVNVARGISAKLVVPAPLKQSVLLDLMEVRLVWERVVALAYAMKYISASKDRHLQIQTSVKLEDMVAGVLSIPNVLENVLKGITVLLDLRPVNKTNVEVQIVSVPLDRLRKDLL
jgi:hypothetical protein